jgi:hypothetical protein
VRGTVVKQIGGDGRRGLFRDDLAVVPEFDDFVYKYALFVMILLL